MCGWVSQPFAAFAKGWRARWFVVLGVFAVTAVLAAFRLHRAMPAAALLIESLGHPLSADGFSSVQIKLHSSDGRELHGLRVETADPNRLVVESVFIKGIQLAFGFGLEFFPETRPFMSVLRTQKLHR